jgi:ABC-type polar amino acid transport system ATPase subunit
MKNSESEIEEIGFVFKCFGIFQHAIVLPNSEVFVIKFEKVTV